MTTVKSVMFANQIINLLYQRDTSRFGDHCLYRDIPQIVFCQPLAFYGIFFRHDDIEWIVEVSG